MQDDHLLIESNPKKQVPVFIYKNEILYDSLLIALRFLPNDWHKSIDAKLFRLADSNFEAALLFLFRSRLLEDKFGKSNNSELLLKAGIDKYKQSLDLLFDYLTEGAVNTTLGFGKTLAFSTILACRHIAKNDDTDNYRLAKLMQLSQQMLDDEKYNALALDYSSDTRCELSFNLSR